MSRHVVLAYSGELESSVALTWLRDKGDTVVTLTLDIGQGCNLADIRARALSLGALRAHVLDVRDEFARACVLPALQAGIVDDVRLASNSLAHPLIARKLVDVAAIEQAKVVAHAGGSVAHATIIAAVHAVNPQLQVIPVIVEAALDDDGLERFARKRQLTTPPEAQRASGRPPALRALDIPAHVEVEFAEGVPVAVNGVEMPLIELIESVATIAGNHGIGRGGGRPVMSHSVCEAPAAVVLSEAYDALSARANGRATGVVRLRLFQGEHAVVGHSPIALS